jgi:hypothetical protein
MQDRYDLETRDGRLRLLLDMREGAEVGKAIAAMRPRRDALGNHLQLWLDLLEAALTVNTGRLAEPLAVEQEARRAAQRDEPPSGEPDDDVQLTAWRVASDTIAALDLSRWREDGWPDAILAPYREQDSGPALGFGHRIMDAAIDHLRGVAVLIADERLLRPPLALSRVVLDAAAHLNHVLQPQLDPEERMVRVLNEALARAGEDFRAAQRENEQERMDTADAEITAIFDAVGQRRPKHWNRRSLPYIGDRPAYTSKMIDELMGQGSSWYQLSDVVHNKEDDGWRIMLGLSLGIDNPHKHSSLLLHSLAAVVGIVKLIDVIEEYTGWDLSAPRDAAMPMCQLWAAGAGLLDDAFRESVVEQRRQDGSTERLTNEFNAAVALLPPE